VPRPEVAGAVTDLPEPWCAEPYLVMSYGRCEVVRAWSGERALVAHVRGGGRRSPGLVGLGPAAEVAALVDRAVADGADGAGDAVRWATLTRGAWDAVGPEVRERTAGWSAPGEWDCMWTHAPLTGVREHPVERLAADDPAVAAEVAEALDRAHPTASTPPGDPRLAGWWVVREEGRVVALVGALRTSPGLAPQLVSLGVDPGHRGRGLAGAVLAAAVRDCLAEPTEVGPPAAWLGLYARNDVARRVYLRHGFVLGHELSSRDAR
jgi:GNAT superfamily N-acetyltransferase